MQFYSDSKHATDTIQELAGRASKIMLTRIFNFIFIELWTKMSLLKHNYMYATVQMVYWFSSGVYQAEHPGRLPDFFFFY